MIDEMVDIPTADGAMETFTSRPERGGPFSPVFLLMDAPGIREELHDMGRRMASAGYYVLVPNLYYRAGRDTTHFGEDVHHDGTDARNRMREIRTKMTIPPVMEDVGAMIAYADAQADAKPGPVGVHGYCMSGPFAMAAAARYPDRIKAAASFYGTWLVSDQEESPHLNFDKVQGEVYMACAEIDDLSPPEMVAELKKIFSASGCKGEIEDYPGVHHGFAFPARPIYDKPSAERHWERLHALYKRQLG
ncbi:MAG TPA: hydrolase [Rhodospirillaceae bacterium]|nr:hydrolase [Rhodospirillaceae bacterium]HAA92567.1 hydrolase [Rhodospirillaceae bacterium]HAT35367.1 hydrolase [Rhodospirillaceae bacterium]